MTSYPAITPADLRYIGRCMARDGSRRPSHPQMASGWDDEQDAEPCEHCDGKGRVWNNADPTSGQFHDCEACGEAA